MRNKVRGQRGFTLIEVLVVVAIIVILLAIAIPSVMGALNHARHNADAKYERAAAARATARWTSGAANSDTLSDDKKHIVYAYDSENGKLFVPTGTSLQKGTACGECREHGHTGLGIYVRLNLETGKVDVCWAEVGLSGTNPNNTAFHWDEKDELCGG